MLCLQPWGGQQVRTDCVEHPQDARQATVGPQASSQKTQTWVGRLMAWMLRPLSCLSRQGWGDHQQSATAAAILNCAIRFGHVQREGG